MAKLKPTSSPRQAWVTLVLVLVVSGLFGLIVLPRLGGKKAGLLGLPAPDFALEVIHGGDAGNRIRLSDQLGKPVVIDFWASWCAPCREQMPIIDAFAKSHGADVIVLGINTDDRRADAEQFAKSKALSYPAILDEGSKTAQAYGVRALPTLVVVDARGKVTAVRTKVVRRAELEELVAEAAR